MVWKPPFELIISEFEAYLLESYIPKTKSDVRLYDSNYHEAKIESTLRFAPYLNRVKAWALSMYLGPSEYYSSINKYLRDKKTENSSKYKLIAKAATVSEFKIAFRTWSGIPFLSAQTMALQGVTSTPKAYSVKGFEI
ncbi:MAG: hypothetical protein AAF378_20650 [Cyanobacteria bacterium P01_A01_bin.84]